MDRPGQLPQPGLHVQLSQPENQVEPEPAGQSTARAKRTFLCGETEAREGGGGNDTDSSLIRNMGWAGQHGRAELGSLQLCSWSPVPLPHLTNWAQSDTC